MPNLPDLDWQPVLLVADPQVADPQVGQSPVNPSQARTAGGSHL